jgi:exodeoxyribonuclease V beta subunit
MKPLDLIHTDLKGMHLIEASAGTGKTYTIASLFIRLLVEKNVQLSSILVVTYTVPATAELKTRIRERLRLAYDAFRTGESGDAFLADFVARSPDRKSAMKTLADALSKFDEAAISTIHGFCQRMLKELAFETGSPFTTELIADQKALELMAADDFYRTHIMQESIPELAAYLRKKKVLPETFLEMRKGNLSVRVIPDIPKPFLDPHLDAYRRAFSAVCCCWPECRDGVEELLCCTEVMKQTSYKSENIPSFLSEMDCYVDSGGTYLPGSKHKVWKFTLSSVSDGTRVKKDPPEHPFFQLCEDLKAAAEILAASLEQYLVWLKVAFHKYLGQALSERKKRQGLVHYDDLLLRMQRALSGPSGEMLAQAVGKRFQAALIDEFQDTDPLQYDIFRSCFAGSPLFFIGDPKQAVYSFRGADVFTYLKAAESVPEGNRNTLIKNWRSEPELIRAVNGIFSPAGDPFVFSWIRFEAAIPADRPDRKLLAGTGDGPLAVWYLDTGTEEELTLDLAQSLVCRAVAGEISRLLSEKREVRLGDQRLGPSDIAVLVRTNAQARAVRDSLRACGIPCVLYSDENVFLSQEAFEMEVLMHAVAAPNREGLVRTALLTRLFSLPPVRLESLMTEEDAWEEWILRFQDWHGHWERSGFTLMFRRLLDGQDVRSRLLARPGGERALTNVLHLAEILGKAEMREKLGVQGLIKWLAERRDPEMPQEEEYQLRLESDEDAVKVMTMHKSKGLEFPVVFCPFAWTPTKLRSGENPTFHDHDHAVLMDLGTGDAGHKSAALKELLAENVRLLYVALTRARNRCYLAWGRVKEAQTSALGYLIRSRQVQGADDPVALLKSEKVRKGELTEYLGMDVVRDLPREKPEMRTAIQGSADEIRASAFRAEIDRSWGIASYTSLISGAHRTEGEADRDSLIEVAPSEPDETAAGADPVFLLPKGARTGILLHSVLEDIDFEAEDSVIDSAVRDLMDRNGFDRSWNDTTVRMIKNTLGSDLGGFSLRDISRNSRLSELEFFLPTGTLSPAALEKTLAAIAPFPPAGDGVYRFAFDPVHGFIRGFMDLVFAHEGKYYLIDWKSNHLGDSFEDYHESRLARAMAENNYILQYHLYTVALHRYLGRSLKAYSYQENFGGIFYVFLRGVSPEQGPQYGIFRARPEESAVERMSGLFNG